MATCSFPGKYKEMALSRLNSITNNRFSECHRLKCFGELVNNEINLTAVRRAIYI